MKGRKEGGRRRDKKGSKYCRRLDWYPQVVSMPHNVIHMLDTMPISDLPRLTKKLELAFTCSIPLWHHGTKILDWWRTRTKVD